MRGDKRFKMLYIIGLGLNFDGISKFGLSMVKKCKKVYLENLVKNLEDELKSVKDKLQDLLKEKKES